MLHPFDLVDVGHVALEVPSARNSFIAVRKWTLDGGMATIYMVLQAFLLITSEVAAEGTHEIFLLGKRLVE